MRMSGFLIVVLLVVPTVAGQLPTENPEHPPWLGGVGVLDSPWTVEVDVEEVQPITLQVRGEMTCANPDADGPLPQGVFPSTFRNIIDGPHYSGTVWELAPSKIEVPWTEASQNRYVIDERLDFELTGSLETMEGFVETIQWRFSENSGQCEEDGRISYHTAPMTITGGEQAPLTPEELEDLAKAIVDEAPGVGVALLFVAVTGAVALVRRRI